MKFRVSLKFLSSLRGGLGDSFSRRGNEFFLILIHIEIMRFCEVAIKSLQSLYI